MSLGKKHLSIGWSRRRLDWRVDYKGSKLPDERRRQLPKRTIITHGLHPHPGPSAVANDFNDPEGPSWEEEGSEASCNDARITGGNPDDLVGIDSNGLVVNGLSMMVNPSSSVWKNPDDSDEEPVPPLADDDSSDDEMLEVTGAAEHLVDNEQHYDTDEELGFEDWYVGRARVSMG